MDVVSESIQPENRNHTSNFNGDKQKFLFTRNWRTEKTKGGIWKFHRETTAESTLKEQREGFGITKSKREAPIEMEHRPVRKACQTDRAGISEQEIRKAGFESVRKE